MVRLLAVRSGGKGERVGADPWVCPEGFWILILDFDRVGADLHVCPKMGLFGELLEQG
jgi:hypothetical protein